MGEEGSGWLGSSSFRTGLLAPFVARLGWPIGNWPLAASPPRFVGRSLRCSPFPRRHRGPSRRQWAGPWASEGRGLLAGRLERLTAAGLLLPLEKDEDIKKIQAQIGSGMQTNATHLKTYLKTWDVYREIWEVNKDAFINRYRHLNPLVSSFDADTAR